MNPNPNAIHFGWPGEGVTLVIIHATAEDLLAYNVIFLVVLVRGV
jgi:hypothetical protein